MAKQPRWVVVTGAAQGIGLAIARQFLRTDTNVVMVDEDGGVLRRAVAEVAAEFGSSRALAISGSVVNRRILSEIGDLFADRACGGIVNNAACMERGGLAELSAESFHKLMAVNALAPLLLVRELEGPLAEATGKVVNIGSTNAYGGEPHLLPYSMSKAALACATKNLAPVLAKKGIQICQVNLGWVLTDAEKQRKVAEGWAQDWFEHVDPARAPYGRLLLPDEVADFVAHLFTPACRMLNGSIIDFVQSPIRD